MNRRQFLARAAALPVLAGCTRLPRTDAADPTPLRRVRPGEPGWPSEASWEALRRAVGGRLIRVESPLDACRGAPRGAACAEALRGLSNPYYVGDQPALTQTSGWLDAWTSAPSAYAVAATDAADVRAAVDFAREHRLRLVVRGGGHSYQGTSNAPDSLLVWTRRMDDVVLHEAFVARGCGGRHAPRPAVTVGAGALWMPVYHAVAARGGRYVQGGGCATVGVAGLVQSGGFGSFSKRYGLAAAGLLEAEVVTADGAVRIANACTHPDLFWALKGGGGGSFGVVTRLTLKTEALPDTFGVVLGTIRATSDAAFRRLLDALLAFYRDGLFNPTWGEQLRFDPDNTLQLGLVFQGVDRRRAEEVWRPFLAWLADSPRDFAWSAPLQILDAPARHLWDAAFLRANAPRLIAADERPGAPAEHVYWAADRGEVGQFLHAYRSAWLDASLLDGARRGALTDALFAASRHWGVSLHLNKGLAGAPEDVRAAARETAMNPVVVDAFALAIVAGYGPPNYPGMPERAGERALARRNAAAIGKAMDELSRVVTRPGSYVSESDFFERDWQRAYWGENYPRLAAVKRRYDPDGLFIVHHGVGSEHWSADGFTRAPGA